MTDRGKHVLRRDDRLYPRFLSEVPDAPERLYVWGDPAVLSTPCLAVIGSRKATPYGIAAAQLVATCAAESGVCVVSGGAMGCDQAAGHAALRAGGVHIAVLGCGADVVYPKSSAALLSRCAESGGAVVSLDPWGTPPRRYAFPRRNRVIAGLSRAVCIVEAALPSGTFSTAEAAMDYGREVLAVPGSIWSPHSRGSNRLIADGACGLVDEESIEVAVSRIFGTLRFQRVVPGGPSDIGKRELAVLDALIANPMRAESVAAFLKASPLEALTVLSSMQASGLVARLPDGAFAASVRTLHARSAIMHNVGS